MSRFQPLTGPGFKVTKQAGTVEQVRAEIQRRIGELAGAANQVPVPFIVPADRGLHVANWRVEDWSMVPTAHRTAIEQAVVAVMGQLDVQEGQE